uniref:MSP domain-containing protein n=1 Tax=Syphacia muris TaxID=451379 RepID=A0A0N5AZW6_9BILA
MPHRQYQRLSFCSFGKTVYASKQFVLQIRTIPGSNETKYLASQRLINVTSNLKRHTESMVTVAMIARFQVLLMPFTAPATTAAEKPIPHLCKS